MRLVRWHTLTADVIVFLIVVKINDRSKTSICEHDVFFEAAQTGFIDAEITSRRCCMMTHLVMFIDFGNFGCRYLQSVAFNLLAEVAQELIKAIYCLQNNFKLWTILES